MTDLNKRIDALEKLAAEGGLIAQLAADPKARSSNAKLANELRRLAAKLRGLLTPKQRLHRYRKIRRRRDALAEFRATTPTIDEAGYDRVDQKRRATPSSSSGH
jgi:hypothetical protein